MKSVLKVFRVTFIVALMSLSFAFAAKAQYYVRMETGPDTEHLNDDYAVHEVYDFYVRCYTSATCDPSTRINFPSDILVSFTSSYSIVASFGNYSSGPNSSDYSGGMGDSEIEMHSFAVHLANYSPDYYTFDFSIYATSAYSYDPTITYTVVQ